MNKRTSVCRAASAGMSIACGLGLTVSPAKAVVVHADSVFLNTDWSVDHQHSTGTVFGGGVGFQVGGGGNPQEFRRAEQADFTNVLVSWHMRAGATYEPAVNGAVHSVRFSVDIRALQSLFGINVGVGLGIEQGGIYYFHSAFLNNLDHWAHFDGVFHQDDFGTAEPPLRHPDFSAGGAPLRFGVVFSNDNTGVRASRAVGVDNWQVEVRPVCRADFNDDGLVNPDDLSDFITCFFLDVQFPGTCVAADFNADGFRDPDDLSDFITTFFTTEC